MSLGAASFYILVLPVLVMQFLMLAFLPSLVSDRKSVKEIGKAVYCCLLQTIGLVLMSVTGIAALYGAAGGIMLSANIYLAMLLIFTFGGLIFLWHDTVLQSVPAEAKDGTLTVYLYTWKLMGFGCVLFGAVWLVLIMLLSNGPLEVLWWLMPTILLVYGLLVSWCTRWEPSDPVFSAAPMVAPPTRPVAPIIIAQEKAVKPPMTTKKKSPPLRLPKK